ncbi:ATP-binding protein [Pseudobowmanella zhangzhouensis]
MDAIELLMRPKAQEKRLTLRVEIDKACPRYVMVDEGRLRQILLNMVSNGIKFTEHGKVQIKVQCQHIDDSMAYLRFMVKDSGVGVAEADHERLFQRFTTLDPSYSRRFGGTGLGLSICRELVILMGGEIGVNSEPGVGSEFWFTVPVRLAQGYGNADEDKERESQMNAYQPVKILVAEDVVTNRLVIKAMLESAGHKVTLVENGIQALQAVQMTDYALVLMDVSMPEMDGHTATQEIRKLTSPSSHGVIIALTAHTMESEIQQCLDSGMDDVLTKPVGKRALLDKIQHWVDERQLVPLRPEMNGLAGQPEVRDAAGSAADSDGIDWTVVFQMGEDVGFEVVPELVSIFVNDTLTRLDAVEDAIELNDLTELQRLTHALASSCGSYGLTPHAESAKRIEFACKEGDVTRAVSEATRLVAGCHSSLQIMSATLEQRLQTHRRIS